MPLLRDKTLAQTPGTQPGRAEAPTTRLPAASRPTRPMACGSRSRASRSAAASSTRFARPTSASSTTRSVRRRRSVRRQDRAIPATCVRRHEPVRMARRSRPVRRNRRSGTDRRHLSIHDRRDRRHQQRQHGSDARRSRHHDLRLRLQARSSTSRLFSNFSVSVDYYDIDISNVIAPIAGGTAMSKCYNLDGTNPTYDPANPFCAALRRNPTHRRRRHGRGAVPEPRWIAHQRHRRADRLEDSRRSRQPRPQHPRQLHRLVRNAAAAWVRRGRSSRAPSTARRTAASRFRTGRR